MSQMPSIGLCLLALSIVACASPKVGYDYDPEAAISAYRTYDWMTARQEATGDKRVDSPLVDGRIRAAIAAQLRAKGYATPVDGTPDFFVAYHAGIKDVLIGASSQRYIGDLVHGTYTTISDIRPTNEGGLMVDVIDGASQRLVWRGFAQAEVDPSWTPEKRNERMAQVIEAMFAHFPPK